MTVIIYICLRNNKGAVMGKNLRIIFTGGGSGGHTMPAFSMINGLKKHALEKGIDPEILYIGSCNGIEKLVAHKNRIEYRCINTGKLRRYISLKNITDIINIIIGYFQSGSIIKKFRPDVLVSTGGFVSVPPVISASRRKVPVVIHEQTIDAGLANRIASKFASVVAVTFEESAGHFPAGKTVVTGIPLREEIFSGSKTRFFKNSGFDKKKPVIYFTGGGLGCHVLNETALPMLGSLLKRASVVFQTGRSDNNADYEKMVSFRESLPAGLKKSFLVYDFIHDDLADILSAAGLAVSRSGAGTVNEMMALNIPAVFIPLAIATNDEQTKNAMVMKNMGGAEIIEEDRLDSQTLAKTIEDILFTGRLKKMKDALRKNRGANGLQNMLDIFLKYAK